MRGNHKAKLILDTLLKMICIKKKNNIALNIDLKTEKCPLYYFQENVKKNENIRRVNFKHFCAGWTYLKKIDNI